MYCPNCGKPVKDSAKFCGSCGAPLDSSVDVQRTAPTPAPTPTTAPSPAPSPATPPKRGGISRRTAIVAACSGVAAAGAAIAVGVLAKHRQETATDDSSGASTASHAVAAGALARPQLVTIPTDDDTEAVPGLASYRTDSSGSVASPLTGSLGYDPSSAVNAEAFYLDDMNEDFVSALQDNGFAVYKSAWDEFYEIYELNRYELRANFVTVDSLMHTYHLYFQHLLKETERSTLSDRITSMGAQLLSESLSQYDTLAGSEWDAAIKRNVAFFGVAQTLMGQNPQLPSELTDTVTTEVSAIEAASGMDTSAITGGLEDYSQYKPRGYYEGDDELERYFRTMMWYGRTNFQQSDEDLDRSACLMALAIHDAALDDWEAVYTITSFFAGASDDSGYYEYYPLVEAAFGDGTTVSDLVGNTDAWNVFHASTASLDPPKINSVVYVKTDSTADNDDELNEQKGFRLMGQRFSLDEAIFEQLLPDAIGENSSGEKRTLPSGLDITAALGSDTALSLLSNEGVTDYEGYDDQMDDLRTTLANADDSLWTASLYSQWLYTLNPLLATHDESYPDFMRTEMWNRRNLQTYLGSYTELKHDTVLYAKQILVEMGGGGMDEYDDRGYVEPEAELYRRMQNLVTCTSAGLSGYDALDDDDASNLSILASLAGQLADIADAELEGGTLTDDQYELIRSYGGLLEHFWSEVHKNDTSPNGASSISARDFPAALVTDVASNADTGTCLELGTGYVNEIYILFELEGKLHIASGASCSYYEFEQPLSNRLTDTEWRELMGIEAGDDLSYSHDGAVDQPSWVEDFTFGDQS